MDGGEAEFEYSDLSPYTIPYAKRHSGGGMHILDKAQLKEQKKILQYILRRMGKNLSQGKSIVNVSLPVGIFEPRSFLQRMTDHWGFIEHFLTLAAETDTPLERMKYTICFIIAGLHLGAKQAKPFNPIIGETYQAEMPGGTQLFLEQVSHHPPVSAFQVIGPDGIFAYSGSHEYKASMAVNSVTGSQVGRNKVSFKDGTEIFFSYPDCIIKGIMMGDRVVSYKKDLIFVDRKNGLRASISFGPQKRERVGSLGGIRNGRKKKIIDLLHGGIHQIMESGQPSVYPLAYISGSWMEEILFLDHDESMVGPPARPGKRSKSQASTPQARGQVYWTIRETLPSRAKSVPLECALPSDSRHRTDLKILKMGEKEEAQAAKEEMEQLQREEAKWRSDFKKANPHIGRVKAQPRPPQGASTVKGQ